MQLVGSNQYCKTTNLYHQMFDVFELYVVLVRQFFYVLYLFVYFVILSKVFKNCLYRNF